MQMQRGPTSYRTTAVIYILYQCNYEDFALNVNRAYSLVEDMFFC